MKIGSLFSGIGGLELGLERAGVGHTVWQVEQSEFCRQVLAKHWPDATRYEDVTTCDWSTVEPVDVICGGFPCQDISLAGKGAGLAGDRSGLWRCYADAIRQLRPRFVVVENVAALLARGLGDVLADLAACGYDAEWDCIPAAAVGAPHRRDRLFVVAYANGRGHGGTQVGGGVGRLDRGDEGSPRERERSRPVAVDRSAPLADADGAGREQRCWPEPVDPQQRPAQRGGEDVADAEGFTVRSGLCASEPGRVGRRRSGDFGGEGHTWAVEPDVGRVADGVPRRVDRLRALGNAVVPQVAEGVGRRLMELAA